MSDSKQAVHSFFQPRKPQKPSPISASTPNDPKRPDSAKTKKADSTQKTDATPFPPAARLNPRLQQQRAPKQTHQEQQRQHGEPAASFNGYVKKGECSTPYYAPITRPKFHSDALEHQAQASYEENQRRTAQKKSQKNDHEFSRMNRRIFGNGHITDKTFEAGGPCSLFRHRNTATAVDLQQYVKDHQHEFFQQRKHTRERHKCKNSCSGDVHMPLQISQHDEVEEFLSECFPSWHKFSSCVMLLQSIFDDRSRRTGDSSNKQWIDKYRPRHLNGLLGERHNYRYIKDWLHQMKIEPLSAPSLTVDKSNKKHIKKKKKKHKKLVMQHDEAFDDEEAFLKSLSLYEDESDQDFMLGPHSSSSRSSKKELKKGSMRSNIILLVGDHGIGKTACVYTIAEQMDYEVFEINAGSRRSGKDIMSAVGEMTKSHLVAFGIGSPASASSLFLERPNLSSTASAAKTGRKKRLNPSLRSPPSGTMTANTNLTLKDFLVKNKAPSLPPLPPVSTPPPTKQSLILLEEVDVLFEEDKGFWASVVELSQNSKRPIIMTCNDVEQVPIENMSLQVIIDMKPPTENELLAYLWLVCFAEGYTVDPADLVCLVAFLGRDIRQLIQTLELYAGQGIFGHYLGLSRDMDMVETKSRCVSSRVAIDTFRLGRSYQRLDGYAKNEETEDLDDIEKILDNNAYIDTWLRWKERGTMVQESVQDQLNGYTTLWIQEDQEDSHQHVSKELQCVATVLNSSRVEWIMDEESHWDELCDASNIHYDDCREAIERVLPVRQAYQPNEQTIMMEYVPYIQQMAVPVDKHHKSRTRSKRKRIHLPLDQDALATLTNPKPPIDEVC